VADETGIPGDETAANRSVDSDVSSTRDQQRAEARRAKAERRRQAVAWIAEGRSQAEVARLLGMAKRSIERWAADPAFRADVERLLRDRELAAHHAATLRARRAHVPEPIHPDAVAEGRAEMARQREILLARQAERAQAARPLTDALVIDWILQQPVNDESDYLDRRDAERGRVSPRALRRYRGEAQGRRTPPQVRVWGFPSIAEQSGFFSGSGPDTRDIFLVHNPHCYDR
jgi:hypothetical protein